MSSRKLRALQMIKTKAEIKKVNLENRMMASALNTPSSPDFWGWLDTWFSRAKLLLGALTAYGFLWFLVYCYQQAEYFPTGLSFSDGFLFISIALVFGFFTLFQSLLGASVFMPVWFFSIQDDLLYFDFLSWAKAKYKVWSLRNGLLFKVRVKFFEYGFYLLIAISVINGWQLALVLFSLYVALLFLYFDGFIIRLITKAFSKKFLPGSVCLLHVFYIAILPVLANAILPDSIKFTRLLWVVLVVFCAPAWYFVHKHIHKGYDAGWMLLYGAFSLIYCITFLLSYQLTSALGYIALSIWTLCSGMLLAAVLVMFHFKKLTPIRLKALLVLSTIVIVFPFGFSHLVSIQMFTNTVGSYFGFYKQRASVFLSKDNLAIIKDFATTHDQRLSICYGDDGSAVVSDIRIWWHGVGTRSYIQPLGFFDGNANGPRLELDSAGVKVIAPGKDYASSTVVRCADVSADGVADTNGNSPQKDMFAERRLASDIYPFVSANVDKPTANMETDFSSYVKKITITGYAAAMPVNSNNEQLTWQQADIVAQRLHDALSRDKARWERVKHATVEFSTKGTHATAQACLTVKDPALAKECNEASRRVDIKFYYGKPAYSCLIDDMDASNTSCNNKTLAECGAKD